MPELPEMQALAERLDARLRGLELTRIDPIAFHGLKTARPPYTEAIGRRVERVGRRAKYLVAELDGGLRLLVHLAQAGRLDLESPPKQTRPRGSVVRLDFGEEVALLLREYGSERSAGWWVLAPGDDGPLAGLGPEPGDPAFAEFLASAADPRRVHTVLRDQHALAGLGRGHTDDVLHRARISPFATFAALTSEERGRLASAIEEILSEALASERQRGGGLSQASLGDGFLIHNRAGTPCPRCQAVLQRVSYSSHEIVYCPDCQTGGRVLADRRLSRLLR